MAKRHDGLFDRIATFAALRTAALKAVIGKRRKPGASAFMANFEPEILRLERELIGCSEDAGPRTGHMLVDYWSQAAASSADESGVTRPLPLAAASVARGKPWRRAGVNSGRSAGGIG